MNLNLNLNLKSANYFLQYWIIVIRTNRYNVCKFFVVDGRKECEWGREGGELSNDFDWLLLMIYLRTDAWMTSSVIIYMNTVRRFSIY